MRALLLLAVMGCASPAFADGLPRPPAWLQPTLLGDVDAQLHPSEVEGENGFSLRRLRLGLRATPVSWFSAVASAELIGGEGPRVFEGYLEVRPAAAWAISLGYRRAPLFHSARDLPIEALAVPELASPVQAFWPGVDLGLEVHHRPVELPIDAWLRVGNGAGTPAGNDSDHLAYEGRVDLVLGRARGRAGDASRFFGLRVGVGGHFKDEVDAPGLAGLTEGGFAFYRATPVDGWRREGEAHLALWLARLTITAEGALALEDRARPPARAGGPRAPLDAVASRGGSVEVAYMLRGPARVPGAWPNPAPFTASSWTSGGVELAARAERLVMGLGARDVAPNGLTGEAVALRWWTTRFLGLGLAAYHFGYDAAPIEEPLVRSSWLVLARATVTVR